MNNLQQAEKLKAIFNPKFLQGQSKEEFNKSVIKRAKVLKEKILKDGCGEKAKLNNYYYCTEKELCQDCREALKKLNEIIGEEELKDNLSSKVNIFTKTTKILQNKNYYLEEDVKEALKQLKEKLQEKGIHQRKPISVVEFNEIYEEIFGEELTK